MFKQTSPTQNTEFGISSESDIITFIRHKTFIFSHRSKVCSSASIQVEVSVYHKSSEVRNMISGRQ